MEKTVRDTIKEIVRSHLLEKNSMCFGQCLTAVGWVGGTLPELYEENNDSPTIYSNLLTQKNTGKQQLRLHRKLPKNSKKSLLSSNFNM